MLVIEKLELCIYACVFFFPGSECLFFAITFFSREAIKWHFLDFMSLLSTNLGYAHVFILSIQWLYVKGNRVI